MNKLPAVLKLRKTPSMNYYRLERMEDKGGEGTLYRIPAARNQYIAKVFNKPELGVKKEEKIQALIKLFTRKIKKEKNRGWERFFENNLAMPRARLYNQQDKLTGFMMNYFDLNDHVRLIDFIDKYCREYSSKAWLKKLKTLLQLIEALKKLHSLDLVVGDLHRKNIFINKDSLETIFVDCDSYQLIYQKKWYKLDAIHWDIASPELKKHGFSRPVTDKSDIYPLGILIYRILMNGYSPYNFKGSRGDINEIIRKNMTPLLKPRFSPPGGAPDVKVLGKDLKVLLGKCLNHAPDKRPTLTELGDVLEKTYYDSSICGKGHVTSGYFNRCLVCGNRV